MRRLADRGVAGCQRRGHVSDGDDHREVPGRDGRPHSNRPGHGEHAFRSLRDYYGADEPHDFRATANHDAALYENINMGMIRRGVFPEVDALEPWFTCAAHSEEDVATTLSVFEEAVAEALG